VTNNKQPVWVLLELDRRDMPSEIAAKLKAGGGFQRVIESILPDLKDTAWQWRPVENGEHLSILIADGNDSKRFLKTLHQRCWLAGYGWLAVTNSGALLDRSIVVGRSNATLAE
jgi:hypothetical protein